MNALKKLTVALTLMLSTSCLFAQDKAKPEIDGKWHIKNVVYLNDGDGLGITEYSEKNNGVVKVNKLAKVEWEIPVDGKHILGMGKYKGNAIIFYIDHDDWDDWNSTFKHIKDIHSAIVDLKSHQLTNDKVVYTANDYIFPDVNNDPGGNFINLSIRTTRKSYQEETKKLTILTLGADGNAVQKEISTAAINGFFIGLLANKDGNTFVVSTSNGSMIVEKFNSNSSLENKLEVSLDIKRNYFYENNVALDPNTNNTIIAGIRYVKKDRNSWISFCQFNFDEKKAASIEDIPLEKDSPYKFKYHSQLIPQNILFTKDKIFLIKEIENSTSSASGSKTIYYSESAVVSIYDKQRHINDVVISKNLESFTKTSLGLSCFIKNEKLYILSSELYSIGALENYCYVIDIPSGKLEKKKIGYNKPNATRLVSPYCTFWFPNECIVSHLYYQKIFGGVKFDTILEKISYDDIDKLTSIN